MPGYRLTVLLKSDLKKEQKEKISSDIQSWVGDLKLKKTTEMGERKLAYPIQGAKSAEYMVFDFEGDVVKNDAEIRIGRASEVIRHLMVRYQ